SAVKLQ
nr:Chain E, SER-ALA-VAL-LYS-LEU-GLN [Severe acute respiratory syndrome coronavirus 2]7MB8_F Chain F, SER-ALA-VAL-LYS-LEU-GLN [Severe acute respiratory syndrome coronavirus 2]7MB8_G Chain G, SER-ALA-VAL-LYS-LEU-GLN [Severe acute respiratory syndrome coronavirus 2]7MB8_H Chain H, SER-ALA-VAL-LYS-LEU-GLN [Severe acute respiratory syndrome coronavirus 2]